MLYNVMRSGGRVLEIKMAKKAQEKGRFKMQGFKYFILNFINSSKKASLL